MIEFKEEIYKGQKLKPDIIYVTDFGCYQLVETKLLTYVDKLPKEYKPRLEMPRNPKLEKVLLHYTLEKVPFKVINTIYNFLKLIYHKTKSEVAVMLWYHPTKGDWQIEVPEQTVSAGGVAYNRGSKEARKFNDKMIKKGYILAGTVHSHARATAYHSSTDDGDELQFDGLHMTMGSFGDDEQTFKQRLIAGSMEIKLEFHEMVLTEDLLQPFVEEEIPKEWFDKVTTVIYTKPVSNGYTDYIKRGTQTALPAPPSSVCNNKTINKMINDMRLSNKGRKVYRRTISETSFKSVCPFCKNETPIGERLCCVCSFNLSKELKDQRDFNQRAGGEERTPLEEKIYEENKRIEEEFEEERMDM